MSECFCVKNLQNTYKIFPMLYHLTIKVMGESRGDWPLSLPQNFDSFCRLSTIGFQIDPPKNWDFYFKNCLLQL